VRQNGEELLPLQAPMVNLLCIVWNKYTMVKKETLLLLQSTQSLGTTVFRGKFFQIPLASLPNSAARRGKFTTYSN